MNYQVTPNNTTAVIAWSLAEGGGWGHAAYNPLNTTRQAAGSSNYNSVGVKNYTSCEQGLTKTVETLKLKAYADLRSALSSGADPGVLAGATGLHTWGTGHVNASLVRQAQATVGG